MFRNPNGFKAKAERALKTFYSVLFFFLECHRENKLKTNATQLWRLGKRFIALKSLLILRAFLGQSFLHFNMSRGFRATTAQAMSITGPARISPSFGLSTARKNECKKRSRSKHFPSDGWLIDASEICVLAQALFFFCRRQIKIYCSQCGSQNKCLNRRFMLVGREAIVKGSSSLRTFKLRNFSRGVIKHSACLSTSSPLL